MSLTSINVNNTLVTRVDSDPTVGSENLVKSGGVYDAVNKAFFNNGQSELIYNHVGAGTLKKLGFNIIKDHEIAIINKGSVTGVYRLCYDDGTYTPSVPTNLPAGAAIIVKAEKNGSHIQLGSGVGDTIFKVFDRSAPFYEFDTVLRTRNILYNTSIDLNNITPNSITSLQSMTSVLNAPSIKAKNGIVITLRSYDKDNNASTIGAQIFILNNNDCYLRSYFGNYGNWIKMATETDIAAIISEIHETIQGTIEGPGQKNITINKKINNGESIYIELSDYISGGTDCSFQITDATAEHSFAVLYGESVGKITLVKATVDTPYIRLIVRPNSSSAVWSLSYQVYSVADIIDTIFKKIEEIPAELTEKVITVKTDGSGDFTTIRSAVDSIVNASKNNPYCIHVYEGTYDVLADYTDEEIRQANVPEIGYDENTFVGIKLTDGISIKGIGAKDKIILKGSLDPDKWGFEYRRNISTLNLKGNCRVENITITGSQLRYCVHDDFRYNPSGSFERIVKDVIFKPYSVTNGISYGCGMSGGAMFGVFENCDFGNRLGIHTNPNRKASQITIVGCKGRLASFTDMGSDCIVNLVNNSFDYVTIYDETTDHIQKLFVNGVGDEREIIYVPNNYMYNTGSVSSVHAASSLQVGKLVTRNSLQYSHEYAVTTNPLLVEGIVISRINSAYIQHGGGFTSNTIPQLAGGNIGDLLTVDNDGFITYTGATRVNAVAVVISVINSNVVVAKLLTK